MTWTTASPLGCTLGLLDGAVPHSYLPLSRETKARPHALRTHVAHVQGKAFLSGLLTAGQDNSRLTHMTGVRRAGRAASPPAQHEHRQRSPLVTWNLPYVTGCPTTRSTASSQSLFWVRAGRQSKLPNY